MIFVDVVKTINILYGELKNEKVSLNKFAIFVQLFFLAIALLLSVILFYKLAEYIIKQLLC